MPDRITKPLRDLAAAWGVQLSYTDVNGARQSATVEGALGVLRALGAPVDGLGDVSDALAEVASRPAPAVEPVVVSWTDEPPAFTVGSTTDADATLVLEDGATHSWRIGRGAAGRRARIPVEVPEGYHTLVVGDAQALLIRAPRKAVAWPERGWGVFMPAYAIRNGRDWGIGDLGGLGEMLEQVGTRGGSVVSTLPLLSVFLDEPFEPSPYSPVSKLFWNELYLDLDAIGDLDAVPEAAEVVRDPGFRRRMARLRRAAAVDHRAVNELKRSVLLPLARARAGEPDLTAALDLHPEIEDYSTFRARTRAAGPWPAWRSQPASDPDELLYHRYVQVAMQRQLDAVTARGRDAGATLLFDMPIGVHPYGYDAWRHRDVFADEANAGAPPDSFFTKGQDWGFHPLHPHRLRESGYAYPRACLRAMLRHARVLRIDHIIGLHRFWWIPPGHDAADGAFVRYQPEEMYAILTLESKRAGAVIVGEDLGTVPREVRQAMGAHGIARTYVLQEEIDPARGPAAPPANALATVNTHDMPQFAAFWAGADIERRVGMGLLDQQEARSEKRVREAKRRAVRKVVGKGDPLRAVLRFLGRSRARLVVANLEDLWGETEPVNVPGTQDGNWRRRGRHDLANPEPWKMLAALDESRRDAQRPRHG